MGIGYSYNSVIDVIKQKFDTTDVYYGMCNKVFNKSKVKKELIKLIKRKQ